MSNQSSRAARRGVPHFCMEKRTDGRGYIWSIGTFEVPPRMKSISLSVYLRYVRVGKLYLYTSNGSVGLAKNWMGFLVFLFWWFSNQLSLWKQLKRKSMAHQLLAYIPRWGMCLKMRYLQVRNEWKKRRRFNTMGFLIFRFWIWILETDALLRGWPQNTSSSTFHQSHILGTICRQPYGTLSLKSSMRFQA